MNVQPLIRSLAFVSNSVCELMLPGLAQAGSVVPTHGVLTNAA